MGIKLKMRDISGGDITDKSKLEIIMVKMDKEEIINFKSYLVYSITNESIKICHQGGYRFRPMFCLFLEQKSGDKTLVSAFIEIESFWISMLAITFIAFQLTLFYPISFTMLLYNIIFFVTFFILPQLHFVYKYKKILIYLERHG